MIREYAYEMFAVDPSFIGVEIFYNDESGHYSVVPRFKDALEEACRSFDMACALCGKESRESASEEVFERNTA